MKRPKCPLCQQSLKHEGETDEKGNPVEEQVKYWMHNPKNLHEDIQVTGHKVCVEKVKRLYPGFDSPTEKDWGNPTFPVIRGQSVSTITLQQFLKLEIL